MISLRRLSVSRVPSALSVLLLTALPAAAQRILVVDRNNRAGAQFTDLPAAEAAAQDGDTLLLRSDAGLYTAVQTSKGISIVCDIGQAMIRATAVTPFQVAGLAAGKTFALKSCLIYFDQSLGTGPGLQVAYCQGRVNLDTVEVNTGNPCVDLLFSPVTIKEGRVSGLGGGVGLAARGCFLDICSSQLSGATGSSRFAQVPTEALALDTCDAHLDGSTVFGGLGDTGYAQEPAITLRQSLLEVGTGGSTAASVRAGPPGGGNGSAPAVLAVASAVRIDPLVTVAATGGVPPFSGVVPTVAPLPSLSGSGIRFLSLNYRAVPGANAITVFGLCGGPYGSPAFVGQLWIDPLVLFAAPGVVGTLQFQVPIGITVVAQVASVSPAGIELSNAVALTGR